MAAEIKPVLSPNAPKNIIPERPCLLSRIDGTGEAINDAKLLMGGSAIISACDDKTLKIWQRRHSGQYWPSVIHSLQSKPTVLHYIEDSRILFLGFENGTVTEYAVASDFNSIEQKKDYLAHQSQVNGICYATTSQWIISISRDKFLVYHCSVTGKRIGGHQCAGWCTALVFDELSNHAFVGDYSGQIVMLKLEDNGYHVITSLKGHNGSIRSLAWEPVKKFLYSGSYDQTIVVWDVGGGKGTAYELQGHTSKITRLRYLGNKKKLVSGGEDSMVIFWNMDAERLVTPEWIEADSCQFCERPFFWNFKAMYDQKQIGLRQHHCRKCGKAVCDTCSSKRSNLPQMGFEFEVRVCDDCFQGITAEDRNSMAKFLEVKHSLVCLDIDENESVLLTVGSDRVMKIWDVSLLLN